MTFGALRLPRHNQEGKHLACYAEVCDQNRER